MKEEEESESLRTFYIVAIIIILIWISSILILKVFFSNSSERGSFGDSFGSINSLFSGVALAGIIYTMYLQRMELKLQRKELTENRKELARTAEAQEKSEKALNRQAENLKISAKLNALTAMVEHFDQRINRSPTSHSLLKAKQEEYLRQIEEIIIKKEI